MFHCQDYFVAACGRVYIAGVVRAGIVLGAGFGCMSYMIVCINTENLKKRKKFGTTHCSYAFWWCGLALLYWFAYAFVQADSLIGLSLGFGAVEI